MDNNTGDNKKIVKQGDNKESKSEQKQQVKTKPIDTHNNNKPKANKPKLNLKELQPNTQAEITIKESSKVPNPQSQQPLKPQELPSKPQELPSKPQELPSKPQELPSKPQELPSKPQEQPPQIDKTNVNHLQVKPPQIDKTNVDQPQPQSNLKENEKEKEKLLQAISPISLSRPIDPTSPLDKAKITPPIIINELRQKNMVTLIHQLLIKYTYKREEYSLRILPFKTLSDLKAKIAFQLKLSIDELDMSYQNNLIDSSMDKISLSIYLKRKPYSYFEIRKRCSNSLLFSVNEIYNSQGFENKVSIAGFPSPFELSNHINNFFRETMQIKDVKIEAIDNDIAIICFRSSALAFDFNRYLWFIKAQDDKWSQMTSRVALPPSFKKVALHGVSPTPRNKTCKRERIIPASLFYNGLQSFPYLSMEERRMKDYKESKKKWVSSKDFITSVGNYSMVQYKKYHPLV